MTDVNVPSSGPISLSQIYDAFPLTGERRLGRLFGANTGIPAQGNPLRFSDFRNKTSPKPTVVVPSTINGTNIRFNSSGILGTIGGSLTNLDLNSYLLQDGYQGAFTFSLFSGSWPLGSSFSTNGLLTIPSSATTNPFNSTATIVATNKWNKSVNIQIPVKIEGAPSIGSFWVSYTSYNYVSFNYTGTFSYAIFSYSMGGISQADRTLQYTDNPSSYGISANENSYIYARITPYNSFGTAGASFVAETTTLLTPPIINVVYGSATTTQIQIIISGNDVITKYQLDWGSTPWSDPITYNYSQRQDFINVSSAGQQFFNIGSPIRHSYYHFRVTPYRNTVIGTSYTYSVYVPQ